MYFLGLGSPLVPLGLLEHYPKRQETTIIYIIRYRPQINRMTRMTTIVQKQKSPTLLRGTLSTGLRKRRVLLTEHLVEYILQYGNLVCSKCSDTIFQASLVYGANLVSSNFAFSSHDVTSHPIGIAMNSRRNGYNNHSVEMIIQFLRTNYNTRTNLLHLCTYGRVQVNPIDLKRTYHIQSPIVSSSNTSAAISLSSPSSCACLAAAAHPSRGTTPTSVFWATTMLLTKAITFVIADSLSSSGLISRNSSARSCIAVIILTYLYSWLQNYEINLNNQNIIYKYV